MTVEDERVAAYLGWWFDDHLGLRASPFQADGEAHEVCRGRGLLVFEQRGQCSRWWITAQGLALARRFRPVEQLALFTAAV